MIANTAETPFQPGAKLGRKDVVIAPAISTASQR